MSTENNFQTMSIQMRKLAGEFLECHRDSGSLYTREVKFFERFSIGYFRASNLTGLLTFPIQKAESAKPSNAVLQFIDNNREFLTEFTLEVVRKTEFERRKLIETLEKRDMQPKNVRQDLETTFDKEYRKTLVQSISSLASSNPELQNSIQRISSGNLISSDFLAVLVYGNSNQNRDFTEFVDLYRQPITMLAHKHAVRATADKEAYNRQLGNNETIPFASI